MSDCYYEEDYILFHKESMLYFEFCYLITISKKTKLL